jgi:3-methyladenine DNA glycosylase AlkD
MNLVLIDDLRQRLEAEADPQAKAWWENYVKEGSPFLGVKMSVIRSLVEVWHSQEVESELDIDEQLELALELIREDYSEEKLAGILYLQVILIPAGAVDCPQEIDRFAEVFDHEGIYDWNICDWFSVKVLGPLIYDQGMLCAEAVSGWRYAENLWQARASLVPFVKVAEDSTYHDLIEESCRVLLARDERFAKSAVAWVLRDISKHDPAFVERVVQDNLELFNKESLRNATKHIGDIEALQ